MVDLAQLPDLKPVVCPTCGRILVAIPYENQYGRYVFLYCNNLKCRHAENIPENSPNYAKAYKVGQRRKERLESQKRKWQRR